MCWWNQYFRNKICVELNYLNGWFWSFSYCLLCMFISTANCTSAPKPQGRHALFSATPQMAICKPIVFCFSYLVNYECLQLIYRIRLGQMWSLFVFILNVFPISTELWLFLLLGHLMCNWSLSRAVQLTWPVSIVLLRLIPPTNLKLIVGQKLISCANVFIGKLNWNIVSNFTEILRVQQS